MRGPDECPRDGCGATVEQVDEWVIDEVEHDADGHSVTSRKALVYWHDDRSQYCIEYPNGETEAFERESPEADPAV